MNGRTRHLPASILQRLGALLVDALLFACIVMLPTTLISWWFGPDEFTYCEFRGRSESCSITPEALRYTRTVFFAIAAVFVLFYSRTITKAGSAGKKATEILVVDAATALPIARSTMISARKRAESASQRAENGMGNGMGGQGAGQSYSIL